ncbi:MAG: hypothetical protein KKA79_10275, partial [Nanoarchaeota archaeon]|nr:hypothetical protein [Nanoarchaeota archaeon]
MKKKIVTLVLVIGLLTLSQPVFSYEAPFHKIMTEEAVNSSGLDNYLKNNLGFEKGFKQEFNGPGSVEALVCPQIEQEKTVTEWVKFGSWKEDHPDGSNEVQAYARMARRTVTHFYDPLSGEGLSDNVGPLIWAVVPSINWAYSHSDHEYSWTKARDYYELALTSQNEEDRNTNFAKTFRALGQVLHLLEDKTVPAHVRNDNHFPLLFGPDMYEEYWKADKAFPTFSYPIANLPIFRDYWDDDSGKGLAEFTNHNFLSRDTNFYDYGHQPLYPFPSFGNVSGAHEEPFTFTGSDGIKKTVDVYYYHWLVEDNYQSSSEENKYLTAHSYWDFESMEKDFIHVFSLNNVCHKAYGE